MLSIGTVIHDQYRIDGLFGRGGFATVYKATQLNIDRTVAIKVLRPTVDDGSGLHSEIVARFMREARAVASIEHPNVVTIYDVGVLQPEDTPYIVMQPFDGHDLKHHLRTQGPIPPARFVPLFIDCLDALAVAHEKGIVHRDLKPENLVLCAPGQRREALKIIDFGIAHLQFDQVNLTTTDKRVGTPRYLAPEYIKDHKITPALDVYQMGLILAEALTGIAAVDGQNPFQCVMKHMSGEFAIPPAIWNSALGPTLRRSLSSDWRQRYPSAAEFRDALEAIPAESLHSLKTPPPTIPSTPASSDDLFMSHSEELTVVTGSSPHMHLTGQNHIPNPNAYSQPRVPVPAPTHNNPVSKHDPSLSTQLYVRDDSGPPTVPFDTPPFVHTPPPPLSHTHTPTQHPTTLAPTPPPAPQKTNTLIWVAIAGVALLVVSLLAAVLLINTSSESSPQAATPAIPTEEPQPTTPEEPTPAQPISAMLKLSPDSTAIYNAESNLLLGRGSSLRVTFPPGTETLPLRLEAADHQTLLVQLSSHEDAQRTFTLQPKTPKPDPKPDPKPAQTAKKPTPKAAKKPVKRTPKPPKKGGAAPSVIMFD